MEDSILKSTKKILGLPDNYDVFDLDIIIHINTALATLNQLGIGPEDGFMIEDATPTWSDFLGNPPNKLYNPARTYIYLRVRLLFDPPSTSFAIQAFQDQVKEMEWRLNTQRESTDWAAPVRVTDPITNPLPYCF